MADVKVKYLDNTGLTHLWGIIKENFARKTWVTETFVDKTSYTADKTAFDATYAADKAAADKKYATSLDIIEDADGHLGIALKNAEGKIIPLGENGDEATAVAIPVATSDNDGLMSAADKATLDGLNATISGAVKTYTISKVTTGLDANVLEAYQLMETLGEETKVAGDPIKIYKDSSLKEVKLDGQALKFTYILADGTETVVPVDVSTFLAESEFANGLQVDQESGVVSVKVSADDETKKYLSVDADGLKLTGVDDAIKDAVDNIVIPTIPDVTATGDDLVSALATGHAVTVGATEALTGAVSKANSAVQSVEVVASAYVSGAVAKDGDNKVTITLTDTIDTKLTEYVRFDEMATLSDSEIDEICKFDDDVTE